MCQCEDGLGVTRMTNHVVKQWMMNSVYLCVDIVGYDSISGYLTAGGDEVFDFEVFRLCKIHHLVSCWRKYEVYIFKNIRRFYYIFRVGKSIILESTY